MESSPRADRIFRWVVLGAICLGIALIVVNFLRTAMP
jgi:hypothetical protein